MVQRNTISDLLGQIYDDGNPELKGEYPAVRWSNDIAQKNVSVISKENLPKGTNVFVRNIYKGNHKYLSKYDLVS